MYLCCRVIALLENKYICALHHFIIGSLDRYCNLKPDAGIAVFSMNQ